MAKKKKKKPSLQKQQSLLKAQHRNHYFQQLREFLEIIGTKQTFNYFSNNELERLYATRFRIKKIAVAPDEHIDPIIAVNINAIFRYNLHDKNIEAYPDGPKISVLQIIEFGWTLKCFLDRIEKNKTYHKNSELLFSDIKQFRDNKELVNFAFGTIVKTLEQMCMIDSDLTHKIYSIKMPPIGESNGLQIIFQLISSKPEQKPFTLNGNTRPAIRVAHSANDVGIIYQSIKPSNLGMTHANADTPVAVYIQNHALIRIRERLDCIDAGMAHLILFRTLGDINYHKMNKNRFLIEFKFKNVKLGYLITEWVDNCFLIKTFLFVTNNATPEGKKLNDLTGLGLLDKKYLIMDKLSTFLKSDIEDSSELTELFSKVGINDLFKLKIYTFSINNTNKTMTYADKINQYMQLKIDNQNVEVAEGLAITPQ